MFYYLWDFKKIFLIGTLSLIIVSILSLGGYFTYNKYFIEKKKIEVNVDGDKIKINADFVKNKENLNKYYQVYIYPNVYKITCKSDDETVCFKINQKKEYLKNYPLSFMGQDIKRGFSGEINLDSYFLDKEKNSETLLDLTKSIFVGYEGKTDTGYEKYFEFKRKSQDGKIVLNQMEKICFEGIKNSINPGTFDEENILLSRTKTECSNYQDLNSMDLSYGGSTPKGKDKIEIKLEITQLKVVYKIFSKEGLNYKQDSEKSDLIDKNIIFDGLYTNRLIFGK